MIELLGTIGKDLTIEVEVVLDSISVGTLSLKLHQWDRLREHRREGGSSLATGLQIIADATEDEP